MVFHNDWLIPKRFVKLPVETEQSLIVGIRVSEVPRLQVIVTDAQDKLYIYICQRPTDFKRLLELNRILTIDSGTIDEILDQFKRIEMAMNSDGHIEMQWKDDVGPQLRVKNEAFAMIIPLKKATAAEKLPIYEQLMHKFIEFAALQCRILSKNQAEMENKNQIITKLLVDRIHHSSAIMGLQDINSLTDKQIVNHEVVQSLFLRKGGLQRSLSTTPSTIQKKVIESYGDEDNLGMAFDKEFDPQWDDIAKEDRERPERAEEPALKLPDSPDSDSSTEMTGPEQEQTQPQQVKQETNGPTGKRAFQYLLKRKRRKTK